MKGRKREGGSTEQQAFVITISVVVVLIAAVIRLFQQSTPTDLVGMVINGLGQLWLPALLSAPVLALWWRHILATHQSRERTDKVRAQLGELSPDDFEDWSAKRLRDLGYTVRRTGGQGDHGVDLIATKAGADTVVQCKRYAGKRSVGEPEVRDLFGVMHHHAAPEAMLITAGWFTPQAREWARGKPILLWDVEHLSRPLAAPHAGVVVEPATNNGPATNSAAVCAACGKVASPAERAFCERNAPRFGGRTLCYRCQRQVQRTS